MARSTPDRPALSLDGIIFDMDGVLCDSESFICEAACRMFAETHRTSVKPEDFLPFVGTGENRYLGGVAERYGVTLDLERDKARTYTIYLEIIKGRLQPFPGVREFIAAARAKGLALAIATSADRVKLDGNLSEMGLSESSFQACVTGSDIQHKKPHPEVFLTAAARLKLPPARCLVIEDAPNGLRAAKAAGSPCLGLTTSFPAAALKAAGANWTAPGLARPPEEIRAAVGLKPA